MTSTTRTMVRTSVNCTSSTEARTVSVRSLRIVHVDALRQRRRAAAASSALTRSATSMTLAPGWRCTLRMMARFVARPSRRAARSRRRRRRRPRRRGGSARRSCRRGRAAGSRRPCRADRWWRACSPGAAPSRLPLGWLTLAAASASAHVLEREAGAGQRHRIDLHAHRRLLPAVERHQADARDLRDLLRQDRVGVVVDLRQRQRVGADREREDRRVGGVALGVGRRRRQRARQQVGGGVDRRLHVLLGGVDVAVERELQRDLRACRSSTPRSSA